MKLTRARLESLAWKGAMIILIAVFTSDLTAGQSVAHAGTIALLFSLPLWLVYAALQATDVWTHLRQTWRTTVPIVGLLTAAMVGFALLTKGHVKHTGMSKQARLEFVFWASVAQVTFCVIVMASLAYLRWRQLSNSRADPTS